MSAALARPGPVVVLGSCNTDLAVTQERLPRPGETLTATGMRRSPGGKGLNQAIAARRSGAVVAMRGAVGDDADGETIRVLLAGDGVDVAGLRRSPESTGTALVSVLSSGENAIVVVPGANGTVDRLDEADRQQIAVAGCLVLQLELPFGVVEEAARHAHSRGVPVVLTPAPVLPEAVELLGLVSLLVLNAGEAAELAGQDDAQTAARALAAQGPAVVVTLGDEGALLVRGEEPTRHVPARRVQAVDTTAAGDTFAGALVARLVAGDELEAAAAWATVAASICVTRPGATAAIPTAAEVEAVRAVNERSPRAASG